MLIATHAMGVNFADILTSKGLYQDRRKTPFISGTVVKRFNQVLFYGRSLKFV